MRDAVVELLASCGYAARIVSVQRLVDLRDGIEVQRRQGLLDEQFYEERLRSFRFRPPDDLPDARSLIVVAFRDPLVRFVFHWQGRRVPVDVPPTYLHAVPKEKRIQELLEEALAPAGHCVVPALLPEKLLVVRSGLGRYGRNNIAYVPGMGSYQRPAVFFSDLPSPEDEWSEARALDLCSRCTACARACPAGAISPERFLLHAERCITFWNEKPPGVAFPDWFSPAWHNCLVGCMHCQTACPENRGMLHTCEGGEFTEEETALFLDGVAPGGLPPALASRLREGDLLDALDTMPRNLRAILEQPEPST